MLLQKKLLHLIYYTHRKLNYKLVLNFSIFYLFYKKNWKNIFIGLNLIFIHKKFFLNKTYFYFIKTKIPSNVIFNSILIIFFNIIKKMTNTFLINRTVKFNFINNNKKFYSILRSPFVYKISQEQFFFNNFTGIIVLQINNNNNFFIKYLDFFFKKFLKNWLSSKTFIKKLIKII